MVFEEFHQLSKYAFGGEYSASTYGSDDFFEYSYEVLACQGRGSA